MMSSFCSSGARSRVFLQMQFYGYWEQVLGNTSETNGFWKMLVCYAVIHYEQSVIFLHQDS